MKISKTNLLHSLYFILVLGFCANNLVAEDADAPIDVPGQVEQDTAAQDDMYAQVKAAGELLARKAQEDMDAVAAAQKNADEYAEKLRKRELNRLLASSAKLPDPGAAINGQMAQAGQNMMGQNGA